jgi:hypothetical protein
MLEDVYDTFQTVCKDSKFEAFRIDEHIIAGVSEPKPNVYYKLGRAQALGKDVIVTAKEDAQLPFDIFDVPTILNSNQKSLREALKLKIQKIGEKYGR